MQQMLQFVNEKPRISPKMYNNKLARPAFSSFGSLSQLWLTVLMPVVARITWHNNFRASLPLASSNSVQVKS